ncbi:MAG: energy transducer TonB [Massilia sp.]
MHFTHVNDGSGSKAGKFAVVAGLHLLVGIGFIHTLNSRHITLPKIADSVLVMIQPVVPPPPPPPPEPPRPTPRTAPPEVVVPRVEVDVPPPQVEQPVQATTEPDPAPSPTPAPQAEPAPAAEPSNTGAMRSAVLADANGCAKPEYPANSARNGDTGTVVLALMVGTDGKVSGSRVQKSSGHRELDKAAVNALSMCKFKPAMNGGVPEPGWAQLAYVWTLEN